MASKVSEISEHKHVRQIRRVIRILTMLSKLQNEKQQAAAEKTIKELEISILRIKSGAYKINEE